MGLAEFLQQVHRLAVIACAVSVGWTAGQMWMASSRQLKGKEGYDEDDNQADAGSRGQVCSIAYIFWLCRVWCVVCGV